MRSPRQFLARRFPGAEELLIALDDAEACMRKAASGQMRGILGIARFRLRKCADRAEAILRRVGRR